jgi:porphyrinogen peroxidase
VENSGSKSLVFFGQPAYIFYVRFKMFVGRPPGNYDRLLDFSRAVTGTLFFVPSANFLEDVTTGEAQSTADPTSKEPEVEGKSRLRLSPSDGSLGIGSLKTEAGYE